MANSQQNSSDWFMPGSLSGTIASGLSNGATLGLSNPIQAYIRSAYPQSFPGSQYLNPGNLSYDQLLQQNQANTDVSSNAHPYAYMGANILGAGPSAMVGDSPMLTGAALGALQNLGSTNPSFIGASEGAGAGGILGGVLGSGTKVLDSIIDGIKQKYAAKAIDTELSRMGAPVAAQPELGALPLIPNPDASFNDLSGISPDQAKVWTALKNPNGNPNLDMPVSMKQHVPLTPDQIPGITYPDQDAIYNKMYSDFAGSDFPIVEKNALSAMGKPALQQYLQDNGDYLTTPGKWKIQSVIDNLEHPTSSTPSMGNPYGNNSMGMMTKDDLPEYPVSDEAQKMFDELRRPTWQPEMPDVYVGGAKTNASYDDHYDQTLIDNPYFTNYTNLNNTDYNNWTDTLRNQGYQIFREHGPTVEVIGKINPELPGEQLDLSQRYKWAPDMINSDINGTSANIHYDSKIDSTGIHPNVRINPDDYTDDEFVQAYQNAAHAAVKNITDHLDEQNIPWTTMPDDYSFPKVTFVKGKVQPGPTASIIKEK